MSFSGLALTQVLPEPPANLTIDGGAAYTPLPSGSSRVVRNEWFVEDMASGPSYGFTSNGLEYDTSATRIEITVTRSANGGPQNRPYIRQAINNTSLYEFGGSWRRQPASPASGGKEGRGDGGPRSAADANPLLQRARYATGDGIAARVACLAGPEAGFVTGPSLTIDGGFTA